MLREIVKIDEDRCNGCGLCVPACEEGAIKVIDGKARLLAENLCDGLGACLGHCPQDAIRIETRESDAFDEAEVEARLAGGSHAPQAPEPSPALAVPPGGCPSARFMQLDSPGADAGSEVDASDDSPSQLRQWPVQLRLLPPTAPIQFFMPRVSRARLWCLATGTSISTSALSTWS